MKRFDELGFSSGSSTALGTLLLFGALNVACSGGSNNVEKNPPPPLPTQKIAVNCACSVMGSARGESVSSAIAPAQFCLPETFTDLTTAGEYCESAGFEDFVRLTALQLAERQDDRVCDVEVDFTVDCRAENFVGTTGNITIQPLCEGSCPTIGCTDQNCTEQQMLTASCDCTSPAACGGFATQVACTPGTVQTAPGPAPLALIGQQISAVSIAAQHGGTWNAAQSRLRLDASVDILCAPIFGCATTSDSDTKPARGTFNLIGAACPSGSCSLGFEAHVAVEDLELEFSLGPVSETHHIRNFSAVLTAARSALHVNPDGTGVIPAGQLSINGSARHTGGGDDDSFRMLGNTNANDLPVSIDWTSRTFTMSGIGFQFPEGTATVTLSGTFQQSLAEVLATTDADADGVPGVRDNCPLTANPTQAPVASPVLVVPADVASCGQASPGTATARDVCFGASVVITSDAAADAPPGASIVHWTATDRLGRTARADQLVEEQPTLLATRSLLLRDRSAILSAVGIPSVINLGASVATDLGVEARAGFVFSNADVILRDRSVVRGDVTTPGLIQRGNAVQVLGSLRPRTPINAGSFPDLTIAPFVAGAIDVALEPGVSASRAPGAYRNVIVKSRAVLTLAPGTYSMASLQLEPEAEVRLSGPTTFRVTTLVQLRGRFVEAVPGGISLLYSGGSAFAIERPFTGRVVAPNASVAIGAGMPLNFAGSLFARDVELRPDAKFTCAL
jgi:hypothetical protein